MILDYIYPNVCGFCGKNNKDSLCKKCELKLEKILAFSVIKHTGYFDEQIHFFKYEGLIRDKLLDYKFNDKSYLYKSFIKFITKNEKNMEILKKYDIIIPVPLSKKRKMKRGYNQSELIAKELYKNIITINSKIKINTKCLSKKIDTKEQSKLNKEDRKKNAEGVYELKNAKLLNKKILLVDDIYTTGSTVNECSKILQQGKPAKIGVLTIAATLN